MPLMALFSYDTLISVLENNGFLGCSDWEPGVRDHCKVKLAISCTLCWLEIQEYPVALKLNMLQLGFTFKHMHTHRICY